MYLLGDAGQICLQRWIEVGGGGWTGAGGGPGHVDRWESACGQSIQHLQGSSSSCPHDLMSCYTLLLTMVTFLTRKIRKKQTPCSRRKEFYSVHKKTCELLQNESKDVPQEERRPAAKRIDGQWVTSCFLLLRWQKGRRGGRTTMHVIHLLAQPSITQTQGRRIGAGHRINVIDRSQLLFWTRWKKPLRSGRAFNRTCVSSSSDFITYVAPVSDCHWCFGFLNISITSI